MLHDNAVSRPRECYNDIIATTSQYGKIWSHWASNENEQRNTNIGLYIFIIVIDKHITANTTSVEQAKCTQMLLSMTWVLSQPIKCSYRHHGPIKLSEKHDVMNYTFLHYSSVMVFAVNKTCNNYLTGQTYFSFL